MGRLPIVRDNAYPLGGSRDRRRAFDNDPTITRPALVDHLRRSMGADNFTKAIELLDAWGNSLLGLGEGGAHDARVLDHRPGQLATLFADAPNPSARNFR